ncbi:MAG: hypothetical protein NC078_09315 [Ruminococcus sp.]|nr:hypothetical protein [Ruminococcus sp.]
MGSSITINTTYSAARIIINAATTFAGSGVALGIPDSSFIYSPNLSVRYSRSMFRAISTAIVSRKAAADRKTRPLGAE